MVYYIDLNDPDAYPHVYDSVDIYEQYQSHLNLTLITEAEYREIMDNPPIPPMTNEQREQAFYNAIFTAITDVHVAEYKKDKYFWGLGFGITTHTQTTSVDMIDPIQNATSYPENPDTLKLARWRDACWGIYDQLFVDLLILGNGFYLGYDAVKAHIDANLPPVENYFP